MNRHQLPLQPPPIKGFLRWAYTLSITHNYEETLPWYYTNFIQMSCTKHFLEKRRTFFFDFFRGKPNELNFNNPFLLTCAVNYELLSGYRPDELVEFMIGRINQGYYAIVFIDESKITASFAYDGDAFPHHLMLSGYDLKERTFDVSMFDFNQVYRTIKIPFEEFISACDSMKRLIESGLEADHHTFFYRFNGEHPYAFDPVAVADQLRDYLNSETHLNRINYNPDGEVFGLETYEYLQLYFKAAAERHPSLVWPNAVRHLHLLWEHKKVMTDRIRYFTQQGIIERDDELQQSFEELANKAKLLRDQLAIAEMKGDDRIYAKVPAKLGAIKEREPELLERLLKRVEAGQPVRT